MYNFELRQKYKSQQNEIPVQLLSTILLRKNIGSIKKGENDN